MLTAITALSLVRSPDVDRLHRVALMEGGAGAGDDDLAFLEPVADFDVGVGGEPGDDLARFDHAVADHLDAGSLGAVGDGGARDGNAAAAAGIDRRPREHPDPQ